MQASAHETAMSGQRLAVAAEALYLANLLILPGAAFLILLVLYRRHACAATPLARCHLRQTLAASLWAGLILVAVNIAIVALGGYRAPATWAIVVLYFTLCHAALVLFGVMGLAKAMAGQSYVYPLLGQRCE